MRVVPTWPLLRSRFGQGRSVPRPVRSRFPPYARDHVCGGSHGTTFSGSRVRSSRRPRVARCDRLRTYHPWLCRRRTCRHLSSARPRGSAANTNRFHRGPHCSAGRVGADGTTCTAGTGIWRRTRRSRGSGALTQSGGRAVLGRDGCDAEWRRDQKHRRRRRC